MPSNNKTCRWGHHWCLIKLCTLTFSKLGRPLDARRMSKYVHDLLKVLEV